MNGREFMDAVQYIDEDLLAAAEEMRSGAGPAQVRRFRFRRFAAVAALAAASVLAVFTLRFVSGKGLLSGMGTAGPEPSAQEAAVATEEAAPAEAAPAEAFAIAEEAAADEAAEETAEEAMEVEEAAGFVPAADSMAAAEKADTASAYRVDEEEAVEMKQAADALPAEEPAAAGGQQNAVAESTQAAVTAAETEDSGAASGTEIPASEIHAFLDDALAGNPAEISGIRLPDGTVGNVLYDGGSYTLETGNSAVQYPYLVTCSYAGEDGVARTAYALSDRPALSDTDILQAADGRTGPEHICILLIE